MKPLLFISLLLFSNFFNFSFSENILTHALHLSTFEVTVDTESQSATIRLRVFQDDLRDAIKNANPDLVAIANETFLAKRKAEIEQYFQQHFRLTFDGKNNPVSLIKNNAENDVYWLHFDLVFPEKWQKCTLQADYLMELFEDQSNVGTVILNGEKLFFRLVQKKPIFKFAYSDF